MTIEDTIISTMRDIAAAEGLKLQTIDADTVLLKCGLDSLNFALLVVDLEGKFGVDPFQLASDAHYPTTFGEFVKFYEKYVTED